MKNNLFKVSIYNTILVLCYYVCFIYLPCFSRYDTVKYGFILVVGLYLCPRVKYIFKQKYWGFNLVLTAFITWVLVCSWYGRQYMNDRDPFLAAIVFLAGVAELFFLMEYAAENGLYERTVKVFYKCTLVTVLLTDICIFFVPQMFAQYNNYLIGTKFGVTYIHITLLALWFAVNRINQNKRYILLKATIISVVSMFMSMYVDCSTGMVAVVMIYMLLFLFQKYPTVLLRPVLYIALLIASLVFAFAFEAVLRLGAVKYFIVNILHRDITMSARTYIFAQVPIIMKDHLLYGFGYGTSYELGMAYGGFPDTQNGLLEWIWQAGIPGAVLVTMLIFVAIAGIGKKTTKMHTVFPLLAWLYVFAMLATVEIVISKLYFSMLAIVFCYCMTIEQK